MLDLESKTLIYSAHGIVVIIFKSHLMDFGIFKFLPWYECGVLVDCEQQALGKGHHWIELIMALWNGPTHSYVEQAQ
jgi:hypothetical protein